jgi:hypothetical protein
MPDAQNSDSATPLAVARLMTAIAESTGGRVVELEALVGALADASLRLYGLCMRTDPFGMALWKDTLEEVRALANHAQKDIEP